MARPRKRRQDIEAGAQRGRQNEGRDEDTETGVCVCCLYIYHMPAGAQRGQKNSVRSPGTGAVSGCKPPCTGAWN